MKGESRAGRERTGASRKRAKAAAKGGGLEKRVSLEAWASDNKGCDDREAGCGGGIGG